MNYSDAGTVYIDTTLESNIGLSNLPDKCVGIEVRLLPPYIKNNRTMKLWPFPGYASVYCCTIVISDVQNQLVGSLNIHPFYRVDDHEYLPIDKTLYYWRKDNEAATTPQQLHVMCAIIKSKEKLRDAGKILAALNEDNKYKRIVSGLNNILAYSVTPGVVVNVGLDLLEVVGEYLGKIEDKPLGMIVKSFTQLHDDWGKPSLTPITIKTKDVDFNLRLTVLHSDAE